MKICPFLFKWLAALYVSDAWTKPGPLQAVFYRARAVVVYDRVYANLTNLPTDLDTVPHEAPN